MHRAQIARRAAIQIVLFAFVALTMGCRMKAPPAPRTKEALETTFKTFRVAAISPDGKAAVKLLSDSTIARFGKIRKLALDAPEAELRATDNADKFFVIATRFTLKPEEVEKGTDADYLTLMFDRSLIYTYDLIPATIFEIEFVDGKAKATIADIGRLTLSPVEFVDDNGTWKVDLEPVLARETEFRQYVKDVTKATDDDLLKSAVDFLNSRNGKTTPDPWKPMRSK